MIRGLSFEPDGRLLGIGSLPHRDADEAVAFVARHFPDLPFWPQLPRARPEEGFCRSVLGDVLHPARPLEGGRYAVDRSAVEGLADAIRSRPASLEEGRSGLVALERALERGEFAGAVAIKGQMPGPISLGASMIDREGRTLLDHPSLRNALENRLEALARSQVSRLSRRGLPVVLFVDEPALFLLRDLEDPGELVAAVKRTVDSVREAGAGAGLHCCADFPLEHLPEIAPDVYSFDAHAGLEALLDHRAGRRFVEEGGRLAFGLVSTASASANERGSSLAARLRAALARGGLAPDAWRRGFLGASCGLGTLSRDAAEQVCLRGESLRSALLENPS